MTTKACLCVNCSGRSQSASPGPKRCLIGSAPSPAPTYGGHHPIYSCLTDLLNADRRNHPRSRIELHLLTPLLLPKRERGRSDPSMAEGSVPSQGLTLPAGHGRRLESSCRRAACGGRSVRSNTISAIWPGTHGARVACYSAGRHVTEAVAEIQTSISLENDESARTAPASWCAS